MWVCVSICMSTEWVKIKKINFCSVWNERKIGHCFRKTASQIYLALPDTFHKPDFLGLSWIFLTIFNCSWASSKTFFVGPVPNSKRQAAEQQDSISAAGEIAVASQSNMYILVRCCWQFAIQAKAGIQYAQLILMKLMLISLEGSSHMF